RWQGPPHFSHVPLELRVFLSKVTVAPYFQPVEPECQPHDAFVGLAGAGKLGPSPASPSISVARSPALRAIISWTASMAWSNSSSGKLASRLVCSSFISFGTNKAQIFK